MKLHDIFDNSIDLKNEEALLIDYYFIALILFLREVILILCKFMQFCILIV